MNVQELRCACGHPVGEHSLQGQCKHKEMGGDGRMHHVCKCALGERETVLLSAQRLAAQAFLAEFDTAAAVRGAEEFYAEKKADAVRLLHALGLEVSE